MSYTSAARKSRPGMDNSTAAAGKRKPGFFINPEATVWARLQPIKDRARRDLLIVLGGCADRLTLECYPSQKYLAEHTQQSERTIRTQLAALVEGGFIKIEHRWDGSGQRMNSLITVLIPPAERAETGNDPAAKSGLPAAKFPGHQRQICLPVIKEEEEQLLEQAEGEDQPSFGRPLSNNGHRRKPREKVAGRGKVADAPSEPLTPEIAAKFREFKAAYPKRNGTYRWKDAAPLFADAIRQGIDADRMIACVKQLAIDQREKVGSEFIPMPTTWLERERWTDYPDDIAAAPAAMDPQEAKRRAAAAAAESWLR